MITKAVIPAAGMGTRFLPLTKAMPKEMLPVVHKPVIHYVVEEAYNSGIRDILIITGKDKRAIEDYFDKNTIKNNRYLDELDIILEEINIYFVRQKEPRGLGDAISYAESFTNDESFAVMLGDTITIPPCIKELIEVNIKHWSPVVAVEKVPYNMVNHYGIIDGVKIDENNYTICELVEKPSEEMAPSNLAILGSYVLTSEIFEAIKCTHPGKNGEIQLTDALSIVLENRDIIAHLYSGKRYDIGNKLDWMKANISLGIEDAEMGEEIRRFIMRTNDEIPMF